MYTENYLAHTLIATPLSVVLQISMEYPIYIYICLYYVSTYNLLELLLLLLHMLIGINRELSPLPLSLSLLLLHHHLG